MRGAVRFIVESLLLMILAGGMLLLAIAVIRWILPDEKEQYFVFGCYVANHNDLARWIWKRLRIEKAAPE